ncbi:MAG: PASTA domain-containing protein [Acidimicrobiia bacterium]
MTFQAMQRSEAARQCWSLFLPLALVATALLGIAGPAAAEPERHGVGLFDPASGRWELRSLAGQRHTFYFGLPGDYPLIGDWDCDGDETPGVYRQSDGAVYLTNTSETGLADISYIYGNPGDIPLAGDFNADGCDTVSVYRPSTGQVFVANRLGADGASLGVADLAYWFGMPGDRPFVGDFNGDGVDTIGVQRLPGEGIFIRQSHTTGPSDLGAFFSTVDDRFVAGDWRGEGLDHPAFYSAPEATFHFIEIEGSLPPHPPIAFGQSGSLPVAGAFELPLAAIVTLPNLIGLTRLEAQAVVDALAIETGVFVSLVTEFVVSDEAGWNRIVATAPPSGTTVAAFSDVIIQVGQPSGP